MNILFVADPLAQFQIKKDTTFAMMREAQLRGHHVFACEPKDIQWQKGVGVTSVVHEIQLTGGDAGHWHQVVNTTVSPLNAFDVVLMRKDPPFDSEYFYSTHLLSQAQREGARVLNDPQSLRDYPEKLSIMEFPEHIGPTIVTRQISAIKAFHTVHHDIILKPLDGMGGKGIFRVRTDGLNLASIVETLTKNGAESIMVQKFLPEIELGDKRILIIAGKPVPYALARIPQNGEVRGNLAAGGKGVAQPLTESDWAIANAMGPQLFQKGLWLVGLDVIGQCVTEINVTSPTCFQEIHEQTGCNVAALWLDALEQPQPSMG